MSSRLYSASKARNDSLSARDINTINRMINNINTAILASCDKGKYKVDFVRNSFRLQKCYASMYVLELLKKSGYEIIYDMNDNQVISIKWNESKKVETIIENVINITIKIGSSKLTGSFKKNRKDIYIDNYNKLFYNPVDGKCGRIPDTTRNLDFFEVVYYPILKIDGKL